MRAADISREAPPSPVKTSISSSAIIAHQLRHKRHSVPPKRVKRLLLNLREDASPKASTHRNFQSLTRFTLIYPSCSVSSFGNDRANRDIWVTSNRIMMVLLGFLCLRMTKGLCASERKWARSVHVPYKPHSTSEP